MRPPIAMQGPESYRSENILSEWGKSVRQTAESDVIEMAIKAFKWLVSFGDDVELPEKKTLIK